MEIISSEINSDNIYLVTDSPVTGLVLFYGKLLKEKKEVAITGTELTITKESLGLDSLINTYFKIQVYNENGDDDYKGIYCIDIENNKSQYDYDAGNLKNELDNLNYYDGLMQSLTEKKSFQEANDLFFNYIEFLEKKLNGNNFIQNIGRQVQPDNKSSEC